MMYSFPAQPSKQEGWSSAGLLLNQRLQRWSSNKPAMARRRLFLGNKGAVRVVWDKENEPAT